MEPLPPGVSRLAFVLLLAPILLAAPASSADDALAALPPVPSGALRVYLVRHGQALTNLDPVPDLPPAELDHLTEQGRRQAEAAGRALAGRGVRSVLTSPASRARETAEAMARALGLSPAAVERRLRPMEHGETVESVGGRVDHLVRALARSRRGTSVVLVAHGEVLAAYLDHAHGSPATIRDPKGLATGSITVVDVAPTGAATVRLENLRPAPP
jgi:broad specificity phosphatase PhoE